MKRHKKVNPNTIKRMDDHYTNLIPKGERVNEWMLESLYKSLPKNGKILDIGCGLGKTLQLIYPKTQADLYGIDISTVAIEYCNSLELGEFWVQDAAFDLGENTYDLIINSQTLEHVDDPIGVMRSMKKALKLGGTCYMTTPYPNSNLDRGVKLHWQTIEAEDYKKIFPGVTIIKLTKNHLLAIYKK